MAANPEITAKVTFGAVPQTIRESPAEVVRQITYGAVVEGAEFLRGRLAVNTPVGATAKARQGVVSSAEVKFNGDIEGHVDYVAPASYIVFADQGTRPHWPPYAPIAYWAQRVLGDISAAGAIMRSIARRGTKAQRFVERTAVENTYQAVSIVAASMQRNADRWVHG